MAQKGRAMLQSFTWKSAFMYTEMQLLNLLLAGRGSVSLLYKAVFLCILKFFVLCNTLNINQLGLVLAVSDKIV